MAIYDALQKIASVDVLITPSPYLSILSRPGDNIVRLLDDPKLATRWYWRRRNYLLMDFRADRKVASAVRRLHSVNKYDAFFARYHLGFLGSCADLGPSFMDVDDMPTDSWRSPIESINRLRTRVFLRALCRFKTVFVTKLADVTKIAHADVRVLPCISTRPGRSGPIKSEATENRMLFVGGTEWPPNREGIARFIEKSLPLIRLQVPDAVVRVVGSMGKAVSGPAGVSADDFVEDLRNEYRRAKLFLCPIHRGAGSVVKLAEAAGYGQAIVATSFAVRGYEGILEGGRDLLVADSDEALAEQCVRLLKDNSLREQLGYSALLAATANLSQANIDLIIWNALRDA